jgi:hypothetical protein
MKQFISILTFGAILLGGAVQAQTVGFKTLTSSVEEPAGEVKKHEIEIEIDKIPTVGNDVELKIVVQSGGTAKSDDFRYSEQTIIFKSGNTELSQKISVDLLPDLVAEEDGKTIDFEITVLEGEPTLSNSHHILTIKNQSAFNPYLISVGASFDLLTGQNKVEPFTEVDLFLPSAFNKSGSAKTKFGFGGRFYQSQTLSSLDTTGESTYLEQLSNLPENDTVDYIIHHAQDSTITTRDDLGLQAKIYVGWQLNSKNWFYFSGSAQALKRTYQRSRTSNIVESLDTTSGPTSVIDSLPAYFPHRTWKYSTVEGYYGLGLMFHHNSAKVDFRFQPSGGLATVPYSVSKTGIIAYYLFEFSLLEKKTGIRLGGESRGFVGHDPSISIYASKTFSISKIADLFSKSL